MVDSDSVLAPGGVKSSQLRNLNVDEQRSQKRRKIEQGQRLWVAGSEVPREFYGDSYNPVWFANDFSKNAGANSKASIFAVKQNWYIKEHFCSKSECMIEALEILSLLNKKYAGYTFNKNYVWNSLLAYINEHTTSNPAAKMALEEKDSVKALTDDLTSVQNSRKNSAHVYP